MASNMNSKQCKALIPQGAPIILGENHSETLGGKMLLDTLHEWQAQGYILCVEQRCEPSQLISMMNDKIAEIEMIGSRFLKGDISYSTIPWKVKLRLHMINGYYIARDLYLKGQELNVPIHCVDIDFGLEACKDIDELTKLVAESQDARDEAMATRLFELYRQGERVILICGSNHMINISMKLTEKIKSLRLTDEYLPKAYALFSSTQIAGNAISQSSIPHHLYESSSSQFESLNAEVPVIQSNQVVILSGQQNMVSFSKQLRQHVNTQKLKDRVIPGCGWVTSHCLKELFSATFFKKPTEEDSVVSQSREMMSQISTVVFECKQRLFTHAKVSPAADDVSLGEDPSEGAAASATSFF